MCSACSYYNLIMIFIRGQSCGPGTPPTDYIPLNIIHFVSPSFSSFRGSVFSLEYFGSEDIPFGSEPLYLLPADRQNSFVSKCKRTQESQSCCNKPLTGLCCDQPPWFTYHNSSRSEYNYTYSLFIPNAAHAYRTKIG